MKTINDKDNLTKIYNEFYLNNIYKDYAKNHPNANYVMIDFYKFKYINDSLGHLAGDNFLIYFARLLTKVFPESINIRLHGDEFVLLTDLTEDEIAKRFELCQKNINQSTDLGQIIKPFTFNAGSTPIEKKLEITQSKADYMMYYAKMHREKYQPFQDILWNVKLDEHEFLAKIDHALQNDTFTYSERQYFNKNHEPQNAYQILTKDRMGKAILTTKYYPLLRNTAKLQKIDLYNIRKLISSLEINNNQYMFCIDYQSLIAEKEIIEYLKQVPEIYHIPENQIILCINLKQINYNEYPKIINAINELLKLGYQIGVDQYSNQIGTSIWEYTDINYIKFSTEYWKSAMRIPKSDYILKAKTHAMTSYPDIHTIPIFTNIDNQKEHEYLNDFVPDDALLSGNHFAKSNQLILKK